MTLLIFLLVLSVLILVHEFGHFIAAKRSGVRVFEFALGFPPTLYKRVVRGTTYILNALPFGGYVRLLGENGEDDVPKDAVRDEGEGVGENFSRKGPLVKSYILSAGVAMNILLAWLLFTLCLIFGYPGATSELTERDARFVVSEHTIISHVVSGSPADAAGVMPGDTLSSVQDSTRSTTIQSAEKLSEFIKTSTHESINLTVVRGKEEISFDITPTLNIEGAEESRAIGVVSTDVSVLRYPIHIALYEGAVWTVNATTQTMIGLATLARDAIRGQADLSSVSGPVGIVNLVGNAYSIGILYLLSFTAIISINLAIINLLPIPALDGGRILFVWIEALKGSPLSTKTQLLANGIGFAFLILLMLVITANDIRNLFN